MVRYGIQTTKYIRMTRVVVVKLLPRKPGDVDSIPGFSGLSNETLIRGPMTISQDKLLTRTQCDEAGDYAVPNMLCGRDLVFTPD